MDALWITAPPVRSHIYPAYSLKTRDMSGALRLFMWVDLCAALARVSYSSAVRGCWYSKAEKVRSLIFLNFLPTHSCILCAYIEAISSAGCRPMDWGNKGSQNKEKRMFLRKYGDLAEPSAPPFASLDPPVTISFLVPSQAWMAYTALTWVCVLFTYRIVIVLCREICILSQFFAHWTRFRRSQWNK